MALWYECGNGLVKTTFARADLRSDVFLCCPGPSLKLATCVSRPGIMVAALNTAYPSVRPDLWIGMDTPDCYDPRVWWEPFVKVTRMQTDKGTDLTISGGEHVRYCPNVYFPDLEEVDPALMFYRRAHDVRFIWSGNTFTFALHFLIWMGARRIRLVGCDFGGDRDYHDDRTLTAPQRVYNQRLYSQLVGVLEKLHPLAESCGIEITSCTPNSPVNQFLPYMPLLEAIEESSRRAPLRLGAPWLHSTVADLCRWTAAPDGDGVVVGCAPTQEWMLQWWWDNYSRANSLPVAFANFGISEKAARWCRERGRVIDLTDVTAEGWFRKPVALLRAPFRRILWLDLDVEVLGSLTPLFEHAGDGAIGLMLSTGRTRMQQHAKWHESMPESAPMYCSSLIAVEHGHPLVNAWAAATLANDLDYWGDHEAISHLIATTRPRVRVFAEHVCAQHGTAPTLVAAHWGGWSGKRRIRDRMSRASSVGRS